MLRRVFNWEWKQAGPISLHYRATSMDLDRASKRIWKYYFSDENQESIKDKQQEEIVLKSDKETETGEKVIEEEDYLPQNTTDFIDKNNKFKELTEMYSDRFFFYPLHHTARLHAKVGNNVYVYWFEFEGKESVLGLSGHETMGMKLIRKLIFHFEFH